MIIHINKSENKQKHNVSPFLFTLLVKCASVFKVSFIMGSYVAFFSATSIIVPLAGAFSGVAGSCIVFALGLAAKLFFGGKVLSLKFLAFIVPGFCASLYWGSRSALIRVLVPLLCMLAFIVHPAIGAGWVYSLYWLVPVALYFIGKRNLFIEALGSTFTAHAVGSVIWQYAAPMAPQVWLGLMPVVLIERLLFATGMVVAYHVISYALQLGKNARLVSLKKHLA